MLLRAATSPAIPAAGDDVAATVVGGRRGRDPRRARVPGLPLPPAAAGDRPGEGGRDWLCLVVGLAASGQSAGHPAAGGAAGVVVRGLPGEPVADDRGQALRPVREKGI
jgi:hypothetical protein